MTEFIGSIFASIFGVHSGIATVIISMFPLIELKGGIPVGMSVDFWGNYALNGTQAFLFALLSFTESKISAAKPTNVREATAMMRPRLIEYSVAIPNSTSTV